MRLQDHVVCAGFVAVGLLIAVGCILFVGCQNTRIANLQEQIQQQQNTIAELKKAPAQATPPPRSQPRVTDSSETPTYPSPRAKAEPARTSAWFTPPSERPAPTVTCVTSVMTEETPAVPEAAESSAIAEAEAPALAQPQPTPSKETLAAKRAKANRPLPLSERQMQRRDLIRDLMANRRICESNIFDVERNIAFGSNEDAGVKASRRRILAEYKGQLEDIKARIAELQKEESQ